MARADLQFVSIDNFSPGIYSRTAYQGGGQSTILQGSNPEAPSLMGMAQETDTYRCFATPQGHLAPLPRRTSDITLPQLDDWPGNREYFITGFNTELSFTFGATVADTSNTDRVEMHFFTVHQSGADYDYHWYRYRIYDTATTTLEIIHSGTVAALDVVNGVSYVPFIHTRMNPATPTTVGQPVTVACWTDRSGSGTSWAKAFPDPASPTTISLIDVGSTQDYIKVIGHQNRAVLLEYAIYDRGPDTTYPVGDTWYWTDPNDNSLSSEAGTPFVTELPGDVADAFSSNANELFVVKGIGGGFVVRGSLDNPTVIQLPNLHSLYGNQGLLTSGFKGVQSALGPFYAGLDGVYVWEGGDRDRLVSPQLNGDFWHFTAPTELDIQGHRGQAARWDDWVVVPRNWLFDTNTETWWRLDDPDDVDVVWWSASGYRGQVYGADWRVDNSAGAGDLQVVWKWAKNSPSYSYSWNSQPLPNVDNRLVKVREVTVMAMGETQTVEVTVTNEAGASDSHSWVLNSPDNFTRLRGDIHIEGKSLSVKITCDGSAASNPAAVVQSIGLGMENSTHLAKT